MRWRSRLGANWLGYSWLSQLMRVLGLDLLYWLYRWHSTSKRRVIADRDVVGLVYRCEHEKNKHWLQVERLHSHGSVPRNKRTYQCCSLPRCISGQRIRPAEGRNVHIGWEEMNKIETNLDIVVPAGREGVGV